ncbi:MAG: type II toxin-antitoxin system VapC family toxin [Pirellulales bacterium]|nr:type II toxin-antitoxin system VapC family toxin [Pirellulales bacterium]
MRVLLDTHTFLWAGLNSPKLSEHARAIFDDPAAQVSVSVVSLWEIAIKLGKGTLNLSEPFEPFVNRVLQELVVDRLPIKMPHLNCLTSLPYHHRDPFDRLLIAQALAEGVPLLSADAELDAYGLQRIW